MEKSILILILVFNITAAHCSDNHCHPSIDKNAQNYLIGYGSLMQRESREQTTPDIIDVYPIELIGYKRVWGLRKVRHKSTFLTIFKDENASVNAVYYPINEHDILATDLREIGYCRVQVGMKNLKPLGLKNLPKGTYWVYIQDAKQIKFPTTKHPIIQSYVDIFINGCMDIASTYQVKDFTKHCITKTGGWPKPESGAWINDRVHARRPMLIPNALKIDNLLNNYFPDYFDHRIE